MLVPLIEWIDLVYDPPGFGMFSFITVRSALAAATAFLICLLFGNRIIKLLKKLQLGETIRDDIG
ncbi:MAG: phospho-N-acetylmuramoyl-pentapeptide-transferase, partial [Balneolaceae bacterium]